MNTTKKAFRSLQPESLSTKSLTEVTKWLETLVSLIFPENGIEYWSEGDLFETSKSTLAEVKNQIPGQATVACFVHAGACEGRRIEFTLCSATQIRRVARAKSFGSAAECWAIAGLVADALECVILNEREPRLVDMSYAAPRRYSHALATPSVFSLAMRTEEGAVVVLADGRAIERYVVDRTYGDHEVDALEHDWKLIAKCFRLNFSSERCKAPELDIGALP